MVLMISLPIWCWRRSLYENPLTVGPTLGPSPYSAVNVTSNVSTTYRVSIYHPPLTKPPSGAIKGVHLECISLPLMMLLKNHVPVSPLVDRSTIREQSRTLSTSPILQNDVFTSKYSISMSLSK